MTQAAYRSAKITKVPGTIGGDTVEVVKYENGEYIDRAVADSATGAKIAADWVKDTHAALVRDIAYCQDWIKDLEARNDPMVHLWRDRLKNNQAVIAGLVFEG